MDDELKQARAALLDRKVLRQDHGIASLERQLMREADHRRALGAVANVMDQFLAGLAERLGTQVRLEGAVQHELSRAAAEARTGLAEQVESITAPPASRAAPDLRRLTLGKRSRAAQAGSNRRLGPP